VTEQETVAKEFESVEVRVRNVLGLHARPAAKLSQEAQKFESGITLVMNNKEVDAKSILDVLTLAAPQSCKLILKADGRDAREALERLGGMFDNRFGEEK